jgi:protease I
VKMKSIFVLLIVVVLLVGCTTEVEEIADEETSATKEVLKKEEVVKTDKVLFIIAPNNFRDEELRDSKQVLEKGGYTVEIASASRDECKGMLGMRIKPDLTLQEVPAKLDEYKAVVFIGGGGAQAYFDDPSALSIAREAYERGKIVAAICIAPVILANAGVLEGKKATVWDGEFVDKLESKGATYTGEDVTIDGKIVTANGPGAAKGFGGAILTLLG